MQAVRKSGHLGSCFSFITLDKVHLILEAGKASSESICEKLNK